MNIAEKLKSTLNAIKTALKKIRGAFPTSLPQGMEEYNSFVNDLIDTYKPAADERSIRFAISAMIMRLGPTEASKSKRYFALALHKGAAAQVANQVMIDLKTEQEAAMKAAQEAYQAEQAAKAAQESEQATSNVAVPN